MFLFICLCVNYLWLVSSFMCPSQYKRKHYNFRAAIDEQPFVIESDEQSFVIENPVFDDQVGVTLTRYLVELANANPHLRELESLMMAIQSACKGISSVVDRSFINGLTGYNDGGTINIQGEKQKKLDVITNDILKNALAYTGKVNVLASEEEDTPVNVKNKYEKLRTTQFKSDVLLGQTDEKFVAVFDPLDGSSNVDAGIPTGTIFGIFHNIPADDCPIDWDITDEELQNAMCVAQSLQAGNKLVASGYCLYSSSTFFCLTMGNGVNIFTLDKNIGEFVLTHPDVKVPRRGSIYSFNEGNRWDWDAPLRDYVSAVQRGEGESGQKYSLRYIGSMVGDVHRTLLYGGIFGYPATVSNPNGKLRLLYEAAPMSFLIEQAGGVSLTGKTRILDLKPKSIHQRVPCLMGSADDVLEAKSFYDGCKDPELIARCASRL